MTDKAPKRPPIDWEGLEQDFRAGQQSLRAIGLKFGVTEGAIRKKAKAEGWQRSLAEKVRAEVRERLVRSSTQNQRATDAQIVEAAAQTGQAVIESHRRDIRTGRGIVQRLFDELSGATANIGEIEDAIEDETAKDANSNRRNAMLKAVSLPSRASTMLNLAGSLRHLIGLERNAFNLDDGSGDGDLKIEIVRFGDAANSE